ncbi:MAG TPA: hypothetical protein VMJ32_06405 [Pirellulales bacterium]|nr:hypothetical protein [Pirellulales bacterium]
MRTAKLLKMQLGFERLEERTVLNGTVTVDSLTTSPGTLTVAGDSQNNAVIIHQIGKNVDGNPIIQVLGAGTKLSNLDTGQTGYSFTFGSTGGDDITAVDIEMGGGSDRVTFTNTTVSGPITVNMDDPGSGGFGDGNDVLSMSNVHTTGDVININLGSGTNVATLVKVSSEGDFSLDGGNGRDVVALNSVASNASGELNDTFSVDLGGGRFNTLAVINCSDGNGNGDGEFEDDGTSGIITGVGNHFATQTIIGFQFRYGDLKHDLA